MKRALIRKAKIADVKQIQGLINFFAKQDMMLARSLNELYENIRDFWVFELNKKILGCAALHISWDNLVEIKSVAVNKDYHRKGIGKRLVAACMNEAGILGAQKVFVLTYKPDFFRKFGFRKIPHSDLPHKIWAECIKCPKFPGCDETALLKHIAK
jgi:amino-acid N-acetyltransferase